MDPDDLGLVADTDALLDALAAGRPPAAGEVDAPTTLLSAWRTELDEQARTAMSPSPSVAPSGPRYWIRTHRKTAAATALVVALAGTTGVAAAASGPTGPLGPLHKLLFSDSSPTHRLDPLAAAAARLLDSAQQEIEAAKSDGGIATAVRNRIAAELDEVDAYLQRDTLAPVGLAKRLNHLRTELARIPLAADEGSAPAVGDQRGEGGDDTEGHDGEHSRGQGQTQDGDDQGQDDGDQGGDAHEGDQGGDQQGDDPSTDQGGSDSDDGSSSSDSGDGSTGSGEEIADQDGSGSGDGGDDEGTDSVGTDHEGSGSDGGSFSEESD
jgi:hypothetical protein